jgi:hypothetical protein
VSTARTKTPAARNTRLASFPETDLWNWPLLDGGWRAWLVVGGTLGLGLWAWRLSESVAMAVLACLALMLAMLPFWLPTRYHLRGRGIVVSGLGRRRLIPWDAIEDYRVRRRGIVIVLRSRNVCFDGFGAKYIDGRGRRDELVAVIDFYRQAATGPTSTPAGAA